MWRRWFIPSQPQVAGRAAPRGGGSWRGPGRGGGAGRAALREVRSWRSPDVVAVAAVAARRRRSPPRQRKPPVPPAHAAGNARKTVASPHAPVPFIDSFIGASCDRERLALHDDIAT